MDEKKANLRTEHRFAVGDTFDNSERLLQAFSQTSAIGFAILDNQLRYQAINKCLASINGMAAKEHLGLTVREVFGELSEKIAEPSYRRVLAHGEITHFEVTNAVLPTRIGSRYSGLNINFPIRDRAGRVTQIGIMVVEVTEQRKLEKFFCELAAELRHANTRGTFWLARELQDSINQYHAALGMNLNLLIGKSWEPETSDELFEQSIVTLDRRMMNMRTLVSDVAERFQIDQQP